MRPNPTPGAPWLDANWISDEAPSSSEALADLRDRARTAVAVGEVTALHLLWVLFDDIVRVDPANAHDAERDRVVLGEKEISGGVHAMLAAKGFAERAPRRRGQDARAQVPGIDVLAGGPTEALAEGVGLAAALKLLQRGGPRVFAVAADSPWGERFTEAATLAARRRLDNLAVLVHHGARDAGDTAARLRALGWNARVVDGHDHAALRAALERREDGRPVAVIAVAAAPVRARPGRG